MLKKILLGLVAVVAILLVVIAMKPDDFHYESTATLSATPEQIFPHVNAVRAWEAWSPWAKLDPNAKVTYDGPEAGVGAKMSWVGDHNVGAGSSTISESVPNESITFAMVFEKPMAGDATAKFTFKPEGEKTVVTWSMYGKSNFMGKAMSLVFNCKTMVEEQFTKGLANLDEVVKKK